MRRQRPQTGRFGSIADPVSAIQLDIPHPELAHVAERHRRACRDFIVPPLLPGWLGRVDCLLLVVGGSIFFATASLNSTAVASSKCSLCAEVIVRVPPAVLDFAERSDVVVAYRIALTHHLSHRHVYVVRVTVFDPHTH
jgi:hypothetical protein